MSLKTVRFFAIAQSEIPGITAIGVLAVLSTAALIALSLRLVWVFAKAIRQSRSSGPAVEAVFFRTQLGSLIICLLVGDLLSGISSLVEFSWIGMKGIRLGSTCNVQAGLSQVGNWATAYFTLAIAIHTFASLVLRKRQPGWLTALSITFGWLTSILVGIVPSAISFRTGHAYGPFGLSCGITSDFPRLHFLLSVLPVIVAAVLSSFVYALIFLVLRGTIRIKGGLKLTLDPQIRWEGQGTFEDYHKLLSAVVRSMLWYPIVYVLLLAAIVIIQLMLISGISVTLSAYVFANVCALLLGIANILIALSILRALRLVLRSSSLGTGTHTDGESFFAPEKKPSPIEAPVIQSAMAFPPPRKSGDSSSYRSATPTLQLPLPARTMSHQRSATSLSSLRTDSTRRLLPARSGLHTQTPRISGISGTSVSEGSLRQAQLAPARSFEMQRGRGSSMSPRLDIPSSVSSRPGTPASSSLSRPITPVAELNRELTGEHILSGDVSGHQRAWSEASPRSHGLPPPPRGRRSPVARKPVPPYLQGVALSAEGHGKVMNSAPSQGDVGSFKLRFDGGQERSSAFASNTGFEGHRPRLSLTAVDASPSSPFQPTVSRSGSGKSASTDIEDRESDSLKKELLSRTQSTSREGDQLSAIAWATLVTSAATSEGPTSARRFAPSHRLRAPSSASSKHNPREYEQRTMAGAAIPPALLPRTPLSARSARTMTPPRVQGLPSRPSVSSLRERAAADSVSVTDERLTWREITAQNPAVSRPGGHDRTPSTVSKLPGSNYF